MPGAHHDTVLESVDAPLGRQGIHEGMAALIALPDRVDARLAGPRTGAEAPEVGHGAPALTARGRRLRPVAVMPQGRPGVPLPGGTDAYARPLRRGATSQGSAADAPCHHAVDRPSGEPPLSALAADLRALTSLRAPSEHACERPPTAVPRRRRAGTRASRPGQTREPPPGHRRLAAGGAALRGLDGHPGSGPASRVGGPPASPARPWPGAPDTAPRRRSPPSRDGPVGSGSETERPAVCRAG